MKIKKQDSQRMVIGPTLDDMAWWVVLLVLANGVLYIISRPLGIVVTVIVVLFAVGQLVGNRVVLDKATKKHHHRETTLLVDSHTACYPV